MFSVSHKLGRVSASKNDSSMIYDDLDIKKLLFCNRLVAFIPNLHISCLVDLDINE